VSELAGTKPMDSGAGAQRWRLSLLRFWAVPLAYVGILVVVYLRYGLLFQMELGIASLVALPPVAYLAKSREFLKNSAFFVSVLLTYEALNGLTGSMVNSSSVVSLAGLDQRLFGMNLTLAVQTTFQSAAVTMVSTFFYGLHVFLIVIAMVLFWFTSRAIYRGYTYSMILTSYLALLTFVLIPTAPPWFAGSAQNLLSQGYRLMPSSFAELQKALLSVESDKFAAFPSLHVAYATLFAVYTVKLNPKYGYVSVPILLGICFSILYLGQHYMLDLLGGVAYAMMSYLVVDWLFYKRKQAAPAQPI